MQTKRLELDSSSLKFDAETRTFEGYASKFGGVDAYGDTIIKGAYEKTLQDRDRPVRMRWNHFGPVIGKYEAIGEDDVGLKVRGSLTPGHSVAEDAYASLKHGAVDGLSIGFRVPEGGAEKNDHGGFDLKQIDLVEISVVEEPADQGAKISDVKDWKEAIEMIESLKDVERYLRDACGLPRSAATALVSQCKTLIQSESEPENNQSDSDVSRLNWRMFSALKLNHDKVRIR
jgi:HK97 family phage prohead protease